MSLFVRLRFGHFAVLVVGQVTLDDRTFLSRCALADAYKYTLTIAGFEVLVPYRNHCNIHQAW